MNNRITQIGAHRSRLEWLGLAAVLLMIGAPIRAADPPAKVKTGEAPVEKQFQGRVVCLIEEMHRLYGTELSAEHEHLWSFRTQLGAYYTLLRGKLSEALFADPQVRQKELLLQGRVFPGSMVLDVARIRSVRNGVVHDLFYYCDICAIETVAPGPCLCCREPVYLVEKPIEAIDANMKR